MPPRRDNLGRIPESTSRGSIGLNPSIQAPWTPGVLGVKDWADRNTSLYETERPLYAQAGGSLTLGTGKPHSSLVTFGKLDFLILELGPDQKDSIAFKKTIERYKLGHDLTPKLVGLKKNTHKQGVTYLSKLEDSDFTMPDFRKWLGKFAACKPTILYISGHHADTKPIFYNDNGCGLLVEKDKIRVGKYMGFLFMKDMYTESGKHTIEVSSVALSQNLVAVIVDACRLITSGITSGGALEMQNALSSKHGKPIILGFREKAPPSGTDKLHSYFVGLLARKLKKGPISRQDISDSWIASGQHWSNGRYKQNLGVLAEDGKFRGHDGKTL